MVAFRGPSPKTLFKSVARNQVNILSQVITSLIRGVL